MKRFLQWGRAKREPFISTRMGLLETFINENKNINNVQKVTYTYIPFDFWVMVMEKKDPDLPKLTENDRSVLKKILDMKRIPDSDIAKSMNLSPQAIFKIREKLEGCGIIKGYMPIIDFKKLGINIMALMVVHLSSTIWKSFSDDQISERISKAPYVIDAYRVSDEDASHVLVLAFRDMAQKERYISEIQTKFAEEVEIKGVFTFSVDKIITHSPLGILHEIIDKKDFSPGDIFLNHAH